MSLLLVPILFALSTPAPAQERPGRATVTVSATGVVEREPDQAVVILAVESFAETARQAADENARRTAAVLAALARLGLDEDDIRTIEFSLEPEYDYRPDRPREPGESRLIGYRARNSVEVTIDDLERVGPVIDGAIAAGADRVGGIRFQLRDPDATRRDALRQAVAKASEEAESIAAALGRSLGPVVAATTASFEPPRPFFRAEAAMARADVAPPPIAPGTLEISAMVTVIYELEPPR